MESNNKRHINDKKLKKRGKKMWRIKILLNFRRNFKKTKKIMVYGGNFIAGAFPVPFPFKKQNRRKSAKKGNCHRKLKGII